MLLTVKLAPLILLAGTAQAALFPSKGPVIDLKGRDLKKRLGDGATAIVAFTAPWCGHCKNLSPEYSRAAESLSPLIPFYNVDCDEEVNKPVCAEYGIKGFPTIKAFPKGTKSLPRDYNGERKAGELISYAQNLIPLDKVKKFRSASEVEKWLHEDRRELPHAMLFHPTNPSIPLMWKVLSSRLDGKVVFGYFKDENGSARKQFAGDAAGDKPQVVLWNAKGQKEVYNAGPLKFEPLFNFFKSGSRGESPSNEQKTSATQEEASTSTSSTSSATEETPTLSKQALKRKEMEAKWAEEERRDRLRREKKEAERIARELSDQDRLTPDEMHDEETAWEQGTGGMSDLGSGSPVEDAPPAVQAHSPEPSGTAPSAGDDETGTGAADPVEEQRAVDDLVADLFEDETAVETPRKTSEDSREVDRSHEQSAASPLEEQADVFEYGQHSTDGTDIKDGHVRDEL